MALAMQTSTHVIYESKIHGDSEFLSINQEILCTCRLIEKTRANMHLYQFKDRHMVQ